MKKISISLLVFVLCFTFGCTKVANDETLKTTENLENKIPPNFFAEGKIPGVSTLSIGNLTSSNLQTANLPSNFDPNNGEDQLILGQQLTNPNTLLNMQNAANLLWGASTPTLVANHIYVRFKPLNSEQIETLEDTEDLELQDYPMDYEVLQDGDFYQDPNIGIEDIGWLYSVVPSNFIAPVNIQYEILAQLYITDLTLLEDLAESLAAGAVYNSLAIRGSNQISITRTDIYPNITLKIPQPDICPLLPPTDPNHCEPGNEGGGTPPAASNAGIFVEEQTVCDIPSRIVPLRQARVVAKRWFKVWRGYTNNNGQFTITKNFKNQVKVIVKTKNNHAKISKVRGIRIWQMLFPCKKRIGVFNKNQLASIFYTFNKPTDGNAHNKDLPYWVAATTHNSVIEFKDYTAEFNSNAIAGSHQLTQPPNNLKIIVTNWGFMADAGAAPMFNKCQELTTPILFTTFFLAQANFVGAGVTVLATTLKNQMDVIIGYRSADYNCFQTSSNLKALVYHELGHTQHFSQAGCSFWQAYRGAIITELSKTNQSNFHPYGTGNDASTAPILATGEMWGNHCEKIYSERHYGNGGAASPFLFALMQGNAFTNGVVGGLNANLTSLERFNPNLATDIWRWIPQGLPYDLLDNRNDNLFITTQPTDNVNNFSINQTFNALQSDVRSIPNFRNTFLIQNGFAQQAQINQLFQQYGY